MKMLEGWLLTNIALAGNTIRVVTQIPLQHTAAGSTTSKQHGLILGFRGHDHKYYQLSTHVIDVGYPLTITATLVNKEANSIMRPADEYMELRLERTGQGVLQKVGIAGRLQKFASTAPAYQPLQRIAYFSLPAKVRRRIMSYVLVPGDVHIRPTKDQGVKAAVKGVWNALQGDSESQVGDARPPSLPGFQILATCKMIYGQYHERFYTANTFFLPPGPLDETLRHLLKKLQPEHVNMISRVGVTLGLGDLTMGGFEQVQTSVSRERRKQSSSSQAGGREWADAVRIHLLQTWYSKLAFLRKAKGLSFVRLAVEGEEAEEEGAVEFDGLGFERALELKAGDGSPQSDEVLLFHAKEVTALVYRASMKVKREITERVDGDGWRGLRGWVKSRDYQAQPY